MKDAIELTTKAINQLLWESEKLEFYEKDELASEYKVLALNALYSAKSFMRLAMKLSKEDYTYE